MGMICNKCKTEYPCYEGYFRKHRNGKDGYEHTCNECRKLRRKTSQQRQTSNQYQKLWRERNIIKGRIHMVNDRARRLGLLGKLTENDIVIQFNKQNNLCYYCKKDITARWEIDHVRPTSLGGDNYPTNIVLCCCRCNHSKYIFADIKRSPERRNKRELINKIKELQ